MVNCGFLSRYFTRSYIKYVGVTLFLTIAILSAGTIIYHNASILPVGNIHQCEYNQQQQHELHNSLAEPTLNNTYSFITIGDWGKLNSDQAHVAQQMTQYAELYNILFVISTGDNFYEDGVSSVSDTKWTTTYEDIYNSPALQCNWYAVLGNHDYHNNNQGNEINYSIQQCDHRWIMPSQYYYKQLILHNTVKLDIFFIDTWLLTDTVYTNGSAVLPATKQAHIDWLTKQLDKSNNDQTVHWRIVVGHYPLLSGGEHGNTDVLIDAIRDILYKYNVDMYMCGHDHTLQHLIGTQQLQYYVSGNGAKRGTYEPIKESLFGIVDPGFLLHQINTTHMYTQFIDLNGHAVYNTLQQSKAAIQQA